MKVRPATAEDRDAILRVHAQAIRQTAPAHCAPEQIEAWASFPPPQEHEEALRSGHVFVAEPASNAPPA